MFFPYDHPSVVFTGRWAPLEGGMGTVTSGSKMTIAFSGNMINLHFNVKDTDSTLPHLWVSVDEGDKFEIPVDRRLRVSCKEGNHLLTVIYKGGNTYLSRWFAPLEGRICFKGFEAEGAAEVPKNVKKRIEFIGDSITEGVETDNSYCPEVDAVGNGAYRDDVCASYAWLTAANLDLEPVFSAYAGVGITSDGCGGVPSAYEIYPFCFDGAEFSEFDADFVVINHGPNDLKYAERFEEGCEKMLDLVRKYNPGAEIIVMTNFAGIMREELIALIPRYNAKKKENVFLIDTMGWIPETPLHPTRESHAVVAEKLTAVLREQYRF